MGLYTLETSMSRYDKFTLIIVIVSFFFPFSIFFLTHFCSSEFLETTDFREIFRSKDKTRYSNNYFEHSVSAMLAFCT